MDMIPYRLEQVEKRYDAMDARMGRVEERLDEMQLTIAGLATKELLEAVKDSVDKRLAEFKNSMRNFSIGLGPVMIASILGVGALIVQSSAAGLTAIQAVAAAHSLPATPQQK